MASAPRAVLVALLAAAAVAVAGAHATAAESPTKRHPVPGFGVSVALPATWKVVDPSVLGSPELIKRIVKQNPNLNEELLRRLFGQGSLVKFLGFDPRVRAGFATNLNVIVAPLRGLTLRDWLVGQLPARLQRQLTPVRLPAGVALHLATAQLVRFGVRPLFTDQYAFDRDRRAYLFTYTTLASQTGRYRPIFAASARSIRFRS